MLKNNKKKLNIRQAFTLVEVIVAVGIFVIIMSGSTGVFANAFKSYKGARNVNENIKNSQYAMNLMAKTFRTSSVKSFSTSQVEVCDYSQHACFRYRFNGESLLKSEAGANFSGGLCACDAFGSESIMTTGSVSGSFNVVVSDGDESSKASEKVGKITAMMNIVAGSGTSTSSSAKLQTTSSLRDYEVSNIGIDFD